MAREEDAAVLVVLGPLGTDDALAIARAVHQLEPSVGLAVEIASDGDALGFVFVDVLVAALRKAPARAPRSVHVVVPSGATGALALGVVDKWQRHLTIRVFPDRAQLVSMIRAAGGLFAAVEAGWPARRWRAEIRRLVRARPYMHMAHVAASLGWSLRRLRAAFRDAGTTWPEELRRTRLESAIEMLLDGHAKIAAIAAACGYASEASFCAAFRFYRGCRPSELRRGRET